YLNNPSPITVGPINTAKAPIARQSVRRRRFTVAGLDRGGATAGGDVTVMSGELLVDFGLRLLRRGRQFGGRVDLPVGDLRRRLDVRALGVGQRVPAADTRRRPAAVAELRPRDHAEVVAECLLDVRQGPQTVPLHRGRVVDERTRVGPVRRVALEQPAGVVQLFEPADRGDALRARAGDLLAGRLAVAAARRPEPPSR